MIKKEPLVSVIMPVYNAGGFLRKAIESVRKQTYLNWELIAIDDGSSDNSREILREYVREDRRVRVIYRSRNRGLGYVANEAIGKAQGKYLARFDADDVMPKDRLEKQVQFIEQRPWLVAVGGQCVMIDGRGHKVGEKRFPMRDEEIRKLAFVGMSLQAGTMMVNRKKLPRKFEFYYHTYRYAEDHELLFRLLKYGRVANLPDILLYYRLHSDNSTKKISPKEVFSHIVAIRRQAVRDGYQPELWVWVIHWFEEIFMKLLPEKASVVLYELVRGVRRPHFSLKEKGNFSTWRWRFTNILRGYLWE